MVSLKSSLVLASITSFLLLGCKGDESSSSNAIESSIESKVPGCDSNGQSPVHNPHCTPDSKGEIVQIEASYLSTCALFSDGTLKCWGENSAGNLGNGSWKMSETGEATPQDVLGLTNIVKVAAGREFTCALKKNNSLYCWGSNEFGQLAMDQNIGTRNPNLEPVLIEELGNEVEDVSAGSDHICVITKSKQVKCWGYNYQGQIGSSQNTNTFNGNSVPVTVTGLNGVKALAAGLSHTCFIDSDGVKCAGGTYYTYMPTLVSGSEGIVKLSKGGNDHVCGITSIGEVKCWGLNVFGQIGNGNQISPQNSVQIVTSLPLPAISVSASNGHSCSLLSDFSVWCWGNNDHGQMGTGVTASVFWGDPPQYVPQKVINLEEGAVSLTSGLHNCVVTKRNEVKCWGFNRMGQVGNGSYSESVTAPEVVSFK